MKRPVRWGVRCAIFGFAIALALATLAYALNAARVRYDLDVLYIILWPASMGLMATENATFVVQLLIVTELSIVNAAMYFVIGFLAGCLPKSVGPRVE
jgi:hypothetical protein